MNVKHLILIIILVNYNKANAQKIYTTEEGHIMMMTLVDNKPFKAESHKLALYLDYNTKVVNGVLDLKSLSTDNVEINTMLTEEEEPLILRFTGTIPSEDFLSKRHDPINFNWPVNVSYQGKNYKSQFKATRYPYKTRHKYVLSYKCERTGFGSRYRSGFPNTGCG